MATKKKVPIDPLTGPRYVLDGRIVTMNGRFKVIDRGRIYIDGGVIRAVRSRDAAVPSGFEDARVIATAGNDLSGPHRAAQSPELQRAAVVAGAAHLRASRSVVRVTPTSDA